MRAEKYIAESETFEHQIMGHDRRIVYVYNAASADDRKLLAEMEKYGQCCCDLMLKKVDVYKSNGIAQRLGVEQVPCVAYIRDNKVIGCVSCGEISSENIDELVKQ